MALNGLFEFSFQLLRQPIDGLAGFTLEKNQFRIFRKLALNLFKEFLIRLVIVVGERVVTLESSVARLPFATHRSANHLSGKQVFNQSSLLWAPIVTNRASRFQVRFGIWNLFEFGI